MLVGFFESPAMFVILTKCTSLPVCSFPDFLVVGLRVFRVETRVTILALVRTVFCNFASFHSFWRMSRRGVRKCVLVHFFCVLIVRTM
jgi:hypothetical protein